MRRWRTTGQPVAVVRTRRSQGSQLRTKTHEDQGRIYSFVTSLCELSIALPSPLGVVVEERGPGILLSGHQVPLRWDFHDILVRRETGCGWNQKEADGLRGTKYSAG